MEMKYKPGDLVYDRYDARRHEPGFVVRPILLVEYRCDGNDAWWRVLYEGEIHDWNFAYIDNRCERLYEERN